MAERKVPAESQDPEIRKRDAAAVEKYVLGTLLDDNAGGRLYEAVNRDTSRSVLLRIFDPAAHGPHPAPEWIPDQVRALVTGRCDHLVQILDMETPSDPEDPLYVVMEMVRGDRLSQRLKQQGTLEPALCCRIALDLLQAVEVAHGSDVVPLGLSPERIFLVQWAGQKDFVKVLAPSGVAPDAETGSSKDLVAVGRILWRCLTGRFPQPEQSPSESRKILIDKMLSAEVEPDEATVLAEACTRAINGQFRAPAEMSEELETTELAHRLDTEQNVSFESLPDMVLQKSGPQDAQATIVDKKAPPQTPLPPAAVPPPPKVQPPKPDRKSIPVILTSGLIGLVCGVFVTLIAQSFAAEEKPPKPLSRSIPEAGIKTQKPKRRFARPVELKGPPLSFTIAYNAPPQRVRQQMKTLINYLQDRLGRKIDLVDVTHHKVAPLLEQGKIDLAVFSPYLYVLSRKKHKDFLLVATHLADGALTYEGYIVVGDGSSIRTLQDIKGKKFCFVAKTSGSGYLFPKALFLSNGITPKKDFAELIFSRTHEQAIANVLSGRCAAAAVASTAYLDAVVHRSAAIRLVAVTERIPGDAYCASPKLSPSVLQDLRRILVTFDPKRDLHQKFLGKLHRITGFVLVQDRHYDPIRRVHRQLKSGAIKNTTRPKRRVPHARSLR
jgi:phosphonate transport system substrate-binding protein